MLKFSEYKHRHRTPDQMQSWLHNGFVSQVDYEKYGYIWRNSAARFSHVLEWFDLRIKPHSGYGGYSWSFEGERFRTDQTGYGILNIRTGEVVKEDMLFGGATPDKERILGAMFELFFS